jgi:protein-tyrosine kinase
MSRIHEALKRAEQERAANQPGQTGEGPSDRSVSSSVIEPSAAESISAARIKYPEINSAKTHILAPMQFDALWAKATKTTWKPDPDLIVFENPNPFFPGAEQFRTLRSRLYRMRESQPLQSILISSAIPAEGKTVISSNLAYVLARQRGCSVLLIDADLRSPRIHKLLGSPAAPGLADYLQNTATEFDIVHRGHEEGLCFIPAGNHVTHPSELISSNRMKQLIERIKPAFDWIIIDSPPALPVADASVLGGLVDGVLFVVRANSTPAEVSQKACKELRDAHILGVILNSADETAGYNSYYLNSAYDGGLDAQKK